MGLVWLKFTVAPLRGSLHLGNMEEGYDVSIPPWKTPVETVKKQHHSDLERGGPPGRIATGQIIWALHHVHGDNDGVLDAALPQLSSNPRVRP